MEEEGQQVISEFFVASACWVTLEIFIFLVPRIKQVLQEKCDKLNYQIQC